MVLRDRWPTWHLRRRARCRRWTNAGLESFTLNCLDMLSLLNSAVPGRSARRGFHPDAPLPRVADRATLRAQDL